MADELEKITDENYPSLAGAECWLVFGVGQLAFRFGPYTPPEAGKIAQEGLKRGKAITIISNCGREFDWRLCEDIAPNYVKADPAPVVVDEDTRG